MKTIKPIEDVTYINNQFVNRKEAKDLKKLGFDKPCVGFFSDVFKRSNNVIFINTKPIKNSDRRKKLTAPMYQQAFEFLLNELDKESCGIYSVDICNDNSMTLRLNDKDLSPLAIANTYSSGVDMLIKELKEIKKKNKNVS